MIRLIAIALALAVATSAQAMSPAPLHEPVGTSRKFAKAAVPLGLLRVQLPSTWLLSPLRLTFVRLHPAAFVFFLWP